MTNPYINMLRTAWHYARHERKRYLLIYILFILSNLVEASLPFLLGWLVDKLQQDGSQAIRYAIWYSVGYLIIRLVFWLFHGPARVLERELAFNLSRNFLQERYHQALHLPVKWHQDHHSGATINRIRKAYEALKEFFQNGFMYLHAFAKFLFSLGAMLYFSPLYGCIGVIIGVFTLWIIFKFDKPFVRTLDEVNEREHVVSATLFDSLSNIITVITLRLEKSMETGLMGKVAAIFSPFRKNAVINEWKWFTAEQLIALIYTIITLGYIYQNWNPSQVFYVGGLVTLLGYVNQFTSVFQDVAWQYTDIVRFNTDLMTAQDIAEAYQQQHRPEGTQPLPENWQNIELGQFSFSHQEDRPSLTNLNIHIQRGQRIALVGESGSGKSTLLALLRGLYQPESGYHFSIDGHPATDLTPLYETVTLFPQEPEIFENTILYNITLGLPFEEEKLLEVCEIAHFQDVVEQLPNGFESNIQEKGVNLSGGQKQRLALARGILAAQGSQIVLLDEPTSSVDPRTEALIYERLFSAFADKAVISSLHRLHLLRQFDYVYVLDKGHIAEEGTFDWLRKNGLLFRELWRHQEATNPMDFRNLQA
ncbi:MAG: ABC transporter ATP-binding protein [Siphonobacter sp.]